MAAQEKISEDANILIVKARFRTDALNLYGLGMLVLNRYKKFESYNMVISTFSDAFNLKLDTNWDKFEEYITDLKWKGHFNKVMTASLMDHILKYSEESNQMADLYQSINSYDYENLDTVLYDLINRTVHEKQMVFESRIQEVSQEDYLEVIDNRNKPKTDDEDREKAFSNEGLEDNAVILNVKPIVSPIKGKPVYEIKIGDKIMIKIQGSSDKANYFIDLLNLRNSENQVMPTAGKVIDIKAAKSRNDPVEILTEIGPGVYGKLLEDDSGIKLRIYDSILDGKTSIGKATAGDKAPREEEGGDNGKPAIPMGTIGIIIFLIAILALFIILIFLYWG